ncbi:MAG: hypothetical protein LCI00_23605 [Chloroflexi bacterium]|nr:hypothetical protein [Chloroflexota bacterium]MCC6896042.1 hypothetical protein [Anaerolineae bacterium]
MAVKTYWYWTDNCELETDNLIGNLGGGSPFANHRRETSRASRRHLRHKTVLTTATLTTLTTFVTNQPDSQQQQQH